MMKEQQATAAIDMKWKTKDGDIPVAWLHEEQTIHLLYHDQETGICISPDSLATLSCLYHQVRVYAPWLLKSRSRLNNATQ